jgi:hypothetical protein
MPVSWKNSAPDITQPFHSVQLHTRPFDIYRRGVFICLSLIYEKNNHLAKVLSGSYNGINIEELPLKKDFSFLIL